MSDIIEMYPDKCVGCGACVRVCPSPEANVVKMGEDGRLIMEINNDKCIACGECIKACKVRARDYEDDTDKFFKDLKERKIVVIAHPAIKSAFPGTWQAVLKWFKQNGAESGIFDGSYGADICTWAYVRQMESGTVKNVLSQHCPAVVRYMELYHPECTREIAPIHSPISCEAIYIRDVVKKNYAVACLSPCPAMKLEFEATGHVEYNITFKRLKEYFRRKKVDFKQTTDSMQYDFDDQVQGTMGGIFPSPGGLRYNLTINMPGVLAVNSDGAATVYKELDEFAEMPPHRHPDVFEVLSCSGGCGCGVGVGPTDSDRNTLDIKNTWREVEIDARNRRKVAMNGTDKMFKTYDNTINPRSLLRNFDSSVKQTPAVSVKELEDIFMKLGKDEEYKRHLDCGACGYRSCAGLAEAIYYKRNVPESCIMYKMHLGSVGDEEVKAKVAEADGRTGEIAQKVSEFATNLLADIENIYASLFNIDNANQQSASMSQIVEDILSKIVGFCSSNDSIDEDNLPLLVSTLEKLQTAVASLNTNVIACANDSATIREAMQEVADATTELNVMAHDMVSSLSDKY